MLRPRDALSLSSKATTISIVAWTGKLVALHGDAVKSGSEPPRAESGLA